MSEFVRYIDKTREYYRNAGYKTDYAWEHNDECALAPMKKPLKDSRIGLVSTASMVRLDDQGEPLAFAPLLKNMAGERGLAHATFT